MSTLQNHVDSVNSQENIASNCKSNLLSGVGQEDKGIHLNRITVPMGKRSGLSSNAATLLNTMEYWCDKSDYWWPSYKAAKNRMPFIANTGEWWRQKACLTLKGYKSALAELKKRGFIHVEIHKAGEAHNRATFIQLRAIIAPSGSEFIVRPSPGCVARKGKGEWNPPLAPVGTHLSDPEGTHLSVPLGTYRSDPPRDLSIGPERDLSIGPYRDLSLYFSEYMREYSTTFPTDSPRECLPHSVRLPLVGSGKREERENE